MWAGKLSLWHHLVCESAEGQNKLTGSSWLWLWLEVTHCPEVFIGVERCDIGQHTQVLFLHGKGHLT